MILSSRGLTSEDGTLLIAHKAEYFHWWPQAPGESAEVAVIIQQADLIISLIS